MTILADGTHDVVRWWWCRIDEATMAQIKVSGLDGGAYMLKIAELPDADPPTVQKWLDRALVLWRVARE